MTNCKGDEGFTPLEPGPVSRTHASARVHLSDVLITQLAAAAGHLARKERMLGRPLNIEQFAEKVIRATLGAINANADDRRNRDWDFEKRGIWLLTDDQAQMSFDRWKAGASV